MQRTTEIPTLARLSTACSVVSTDNRTSEKFGFTIEPVLRAKLPLLLLTFPIACSCPPRGISSAISKSAETAEVPPPTLAGEALLLSPLSELSRAPERSMEEDNFAFRDADWKKIRTNNKRKTIEKNTFMDFFFLALVANLLLPEYSLNTQTHYSAYKQRFIHTCPE